MGKAAPDFDKIIREGRERKANEKLANDIFSRNRRQSAPPKLKQPVTAPSLASRISKKQPRASLGSRANTIAAPSKGNINNEWTHDLHRSVSSPKPHAGGALSKRIEQPGAGNGTNTRKAAAMRRAKLSTALDKMDLTADNTPRSLSQPTTASSITIRGLAGPFYVMAQNFARGTTAADVESALTPTGGPMESCRIVKTDPFIVVEMLFASREGGNRVIETFNNQVADGRVIQVWAKTDAPTQTNSKAPANAPNGPRASRDNRQRNGQIVDGTMGFEDPMRLSPKPLYSDAVSRGGRRGRGRGGRGGQ